MKRMTALLLLALIAVVGCESDNPATNDQTTEPDYSLSFNPSRLSLVGLVGDTVSVDVTLSVFTGDKTNRVPAPNVSFHFWTQVGMAEPIGRGSEAVTNADGTANLSFSFPVRKGVTEIMIVGEVGEFENRRTTSAFVEITGYNRPMRLILTGPTHTLIVPQGTVAKLQLNGLVVDSAGVGVPDLVLDGRLERAAGAAFGGISFSEMTDYAGNFKVNYNSTGGFGVETIVISCEIPGIPESRLEERYSVETVAFEDQIGSLRLYELPEQVLLTAEGEALLELNALVLDWQDVPLPGVTVNFASSLGVIQSGTVTDSVGFAHVLWHTGTAADTAEITAYIQGTEFMAVGKVAIRLQLENLPDPVTRISLFADDLSLFARSNAMTYVRATCQTESGGLAEPGTVVGFEILEGDGRFRADLQVISYNGVALNEFIIGMNLGVTRLRAFVDIGGGNRVESNEVSIRAVADEPRGLQITFDSYVIPMGGSTVIHLLTFDNYTNPVAGEIVRLTTSLGDITPTVVTNAAGRGTAVLASGNSSGIAEVTMIWRDRDYHRDVTFLAGTPNVIELSANPLTINPIAGNRTTTVTAVVRDANGTNVGRSTTVVFELINQPDPPDGCTFPNDAQVDSSRTANGVAVMTLTSGDQIGGVLLKAYTWRDPDTVWVDPERTIPGQWRQDTVSVILSTIQVVSGPPTALELDIDSRGVDAGGGIWDLAVSIRAYDAHMNPSNGDYPVNLTIVPDGLATITPARLANGSGRATLSYPSSSTFQTITINAEIEGIDSAITARRNFLLPLQRGFLTLAADPQNWMFDRGRPDDTCLVRVWGTLRDGHDELINNAPIVFTTDRARFFWRNQVGGRYTMFFPEPARKFTGVVNQSHNEPPGVATVFLRGKMADFYLDDFSLEVGVRIEAHVDGMDVAADPVTVRITRH